MNELGGEIWVLVGIGIALTGLAMVYGTMRARKLTNREQAVQQQVTRENFRRDDA